MGAELTRTPVDSDNLVTVARDFMPQDQAQDVMQLDVISVQDVE